MKKFVKPCKTSIEPLDKPIGRSFGGPNASPIIQRECHTDLLPSLRKEYSHFIKALTGAKVFSRAPEIYGFFPALPGLGTVISGQRFRQVPFG